MFWLFASSMSYFISIFIDIIFSLFFIIFIFTLFKGFTIKDKENVYQNRNNFSFGIKEKTACVSRKTYSLGGKNVVTFQLQNGTFVDLLVSSRQFDNLNLGDYGKLSYANGRLVHFKKFEF